MPSNGSSKITSVLHVCSPDGVTGVAEVANVLVEELRSSGIDAELADLSTTLGTDLVRTVKNPEEVLTKALDAVDQCGADVVVTVCQLPDQLRPLGFGWQARLAATLGAGIVLVLAGQQDGSVAVAEAEAARNHAVIVGAKDARGAWLATSNQASSVGTAGLTRIAGLAPSGEMNEHLVKREEGVAEVLALIQSDTCLVLPSGREDVLLALSIALAGGKVEPPAAVILVGEHPADMVRLLTRFSPELPLLQLGEAASDAGYGAGSSTGSTVGQNGCDVVARARKVRADRPITPVVFQRKLVQDARAEVKRIVLPEGLEPRVLRAAAWILSNKAAELTLLGDKASIDEKARELGIDLSAATVIDPVSSPLREEFAAEYARLRAKKGVTLEQARERMLDVSYFGTMLVHTGHADGMVSGAVHTTAHTIRPSFEIIRTKPGASVVSSVFFMCLADQVLVFGDCAVNPNPTPEQVASIAISSAETASQFGIDPRVAMLSYSTGTSGSGPDVDACAAATALVREQAPKLAVDGPLQFDAAVAADVARTKAPDSPVAGRANVLIFPDLAAGNAGYKAVQRTAGALAIGPVLQGLNKPVNDLSRGALVEDIINTILITSIQAAGQTSGGD